MLSSCVSTINHIVDVNHSLSVLCKYVNIPDCNIQLYIWCKCDNNVHNEDSMIIQANWLVTMGLFKAVQFNSIQFSSIELIWLLLTMHLKQSAILGIILY